MLSNKMVRLSLLSPMPGLYHWLLSDQQLDQLQLEIAASFLATAFFERIPHRYVEHDNGSGPMSCIAYFYHFHSASRAPPKSARWFLPTRAGRMQPLAERSWTAVSQTALYRSGHKLSRPLMQGRAREKKRQKKKVSTRVSPWPRKEGKKIPLCGNMAFETSTRAHTTNANYSDVSGGSDFSR